MIISSFFMFTACQKNDIPNLPDPKTAQEYLDEAIANVDMDQLAEDLEVIDDSLAVWGLTSMILTEPNGVRYKIETEGAGDKPILENAIRIKYSGKFLSSGEEFDSSESSDFYLYGLIIGIQTTLPLLPEGTVVTLYIPSGYGYGPNDLRGNSGTVIIPADSNLIFEIELIAVL